MFASLATTANTLYAQTTDVAQPAEKTFWMKVPDYIDNPWLLFGITMFVVISFVFYALAKSVIVLSRKLLGEEPAKDLVEEPAVPKVTIWTKLMDSMTRSVPIAKEADVMLDHNYDGIRELDNQLPPWWKWGFVFTIVFAVIYLISYHVTGTGKLSLQEYSDELKQAQLDKEERMKDAANNITEENVVAFTDAHEIAEGKNIFEKSCLACHGNLGQGNVGPNLTDEFWLHGGGIKNVFKTITEGVPNKGMISWKTQLAPKQIQEVASFILTLKGTNPEGAKDPQGDKWAEEIKTDSSASAMKNTVHGDTAAVKKL
ncbi:cbb3-type cytochrome c oxidase N-terminal domain-containing protein [soil metagenome]